MLRENPEAEWVAVTVTVVVPTAAFDAVKVITLVPPPFGTGLGEKVVVTPLGSPFAVMVTLPVNPLAPVMVSVRVPELPVARERSVSPLRAKGAAVVSVVLAVRTKLPAVPATRSVVEPDVAFAVAVRVSVLVAGPDEIATDAGLKLAVTPVGSPSKMESAIFPEYPFDGVTVMVTAVEPP